MPYKYLGFQSPLLLRTHKTDILFQYVFFQVSGRHGLPFDLLSIYFIFMII